MTNTMQKYEQGDFTVRPELIGAFTHKEMKQRMFRFDVEHEDCDGDHRSLYYSVMRVGNTDRWCLSASSTGGETDEEFIENVKDAMKRKPEPHENWTKLALCVGRPWSVLIRNPVPFILMMEMVRENMPIAHRAKLKEMTVAEVTKFVDDSDLDPFDDDYETYFEPVAEALQELIEEGGE